MKGRLPTAEPSEADAAIGKLEVEIAILAKYCAIALSAVSSSFMVRCTKRHQWAQAALEVFSFSAVVGTFSHLSSLCLSRSASEPSEAAAAIGKLEVEKLLSPCSSLQIT